MTSETFAARTEADVIGLVQGQSLAWIVSESSGSPCATLLPMLPVLENGTITALAGHFARSNPHVQILETAPRVLILFLGSHGYISPSWMSDRTQAPTWNYASAQFDADVELFEGPVRIEAHLRELVSANEAGRPKSWSIEEMGPRYRSLSRRVVGFIAQVCTARARFKLGQDERDDVFRDICRGLEQEQPQDHSRGLLNWMREFNPHRGEGEQ